MKYDREKLTGVYTENDFCFFWGHTPAKDGLITENCLSQWWKCDFMEDHILFCCSEQYMMYHKALLFADYEYAQKIIVSSDPKEIKEFGRLIRGFDEKRWDENKQNIVLQGNLLKFSQNSELKQFLLETENKILVEASPYDCIWGIGMRKGSEGICEPGSWKGQNLLGFAIMDARDRIR